MPAPSQTQNILNAVGSIRSAEQLLVQASYSMTDEAMLTRLNIEYQHLDSFLSQLLHTQALADDSQFEGASAALKEQANGLAAEEASIKIIVADVGTAAKVVGYITQALGYIALL
ncbi:hypothetical protein [Burkholderia ubonensis]|uniref:hypothetical protein n=1 Tax=Burkholderia ubonensis TaxID=101571 RepID=UPI000AB11006|nr:hypothetical protein [Burkholderia ubonensis]